MPKRKIRSYWENSSNRKDKKSQILDIEGEKIQLNHILIDINKLTSRLCKRNEKLKGREEEVKEILEEFIINVTSSKDLTGEIE